ncbi:MAG: D-alanyl-D-alanine carboxypeptidase/D-alanyl-D-alanine-endopeptidase [Granulosicoccus sp.]
MKAKRWVALALMCSVCTTTLVADAAPRTGYILIDASSGQRLAESAADKAFMTASTMKLVTALAALDTLGPAHQFETSLSMTRKPDNDVLEGDLILHGQGDVELDLDDLMHMVLALRQAGITKVSGRFLISDAAFLRAENINLEQPLEAPYNAGIGPLTLAFGRAAMRPDSEGGYFSNPALIERGPAWKIISGRDEKRSHAIPVQDVGMHAGQSLRRMASELGIDLPVPGRGSAQGPVSRLITIKSKPLAEMIEGMMVYSNNQLAETIGLATATRLNLEPKTLADSVAGVWAHLVTQLPETDWQGFEITNHSGLDPNARATPAQLAVLLQYGLDRHALPQMLPANAWSGSLARRLVEVGHLQRIWAKTGSIDFASALAGYLLPNDGGLWLFAIITDDPEKRRAYDRMTEPSEAIRKEARQWERKIKTQHDILLRQWISGKP